MPLERKCFREFGFGKLGWPSGLLSPALQKPRWRLKRQTRGGGPRGLAIEWSAKQGRHRWSAVHEISTISKRALWTSAVGEATTAWLPPAKQKMQWLHGAWVGAPAGRAGAPSSPPCRHNSNASGASLAAWAASANPPSAIRRLCMATA